MALKKIERSMFEDNSRRNQGIAQPLALKNELGEGTDVIFMVIGSEAETVKDGLNKLNENRAFKKEMGIRRAGRRPYIEPQEELDDFILEATALRVSDWNYPEECTLSNVKVSLRMNPHYGLQVIEVSNEIANFPKG